MGSASKRGFLGALKDIAAGGKAPVRPEGGAVAFDTSVSLLT